MAGPSTPAGRSRFPGRCGVSPQMGSAETMARPQGNAFPKER